jgi:hypothetical protein
MGVDYPGMVERGLRIVSMAQAEAINGRDDPKDSFAMFKASGATSPLDAVRAIYIALAEYYRSCGQDAPSQASFGSYANLSGGIVVRLCYEQRKACPGLRKMMAPERYVEFLRSLNPTADDFWEMVFQHPGFL